MSEMRGVISAMPMKQHGTAGRCRYGIQGCTDPLSNNYLQVAVIDDGSCQYYGCVVAEALNYDSRATYPLESIAVSVGACQLP